MSRVCKTTLPQVLASSYLHSLPPGHLIEEQGGGGRHAAWPSCDSCRKGTLGSGVLKAVTCRLAGGSAPRPGRLTTSTTHLSPPWHSTAAQGSVMHSAWPACTKRRVSWPQQTRAVACSPGAAHITLAAMHASRALTPFTMQTGLSGWQSTRLHRGSSPAPAQPGRAQWQRRHGSGRSRSRCRHVVAGHKLTNIAKCN